MKHPQTFLLEKMIGYEKNGLSSLGTLNAKHIDDIVQVMVEFGEAMAIEVAERISKGEEVKLLTGTISLQKVSKKKTKTMPITSVTYSRKYPTGPFLNETIGVEITLVENQDPLEALAEAKKLTDTFHEQANPHLYDGFTGREVVYAETGLPVQFESEQLPITDLSEERTAITIENAQSLEELASVKPKDKSLMPIYVKKLKELTNQVV
jgi:hypothetical protein